MKNRLSPSLTRRSLGTLLLALLALTGCSTNPVTGSREVMFISEQEERQIGEQQYEPAQQSQGGPYVADPGVTTYVKNVGQKLATVSDRPDLPYEFVVLNNSVPNAWALPSGKIAINRGLLVQLEDEAQLAAVLGHEIVHAAARHSAKRLQSNMLISAATAGLGMVIDSDVGGLLVGGAAVGAGLALAKYGREHELESDLYGMEYMARAGYDPQAAVELQQLFVKLSEGQSSSWVDGLFASHPPSPERVEANRETARKLPQASYRGKQAFAEATRRLRQAQPAYDAYEAGLQLLEKEDYEGAKKKALTAIEKEPGEALFQALLGDAESALGNTEAAGKAYDKAVELNPDYFATLLRRGLHRSEHGEPAKARADLLRANQLLPTSVAYLGLGDAELAMNNPRQARSHYQVAARGKGHISELAQDRIARLNQE